MRRDASADQRLHAERPLHRDDDQQHRPGRRIHGGPADNPRRQRLQAPDRQLGERHHDHPCVLSHAPEPDRVQRPRRRREQQQHRDRGRYGRWAPVDGSAECGLRPVPGQAGYFVLGIDRVFSRRSGGGGAGRGPQRQREHRHDHCISPHRAALPGGLRAPPRSLFTSVDDTVCVPATFVTPVFSGSPVQTFYETLQDAGDPGGAGHIIVVSPTDPEYAARPSFSCACGFTGIRAE